MLKKLPLTISEAATDLRSGLYTSVELTEEVLRRADEFEAAVGSFASRFADSARIAAKAADDNLARGHDFGPLMGIPVAMKDVIATEEWVPRGGSLAPSPVELKGDADAVKGVRDSGAVFVGSSVTMEFAIGMPDHEIGGKVSNNPWNTEMWAGGSSSGSGAGLAAQFFFGSIGSDTGGSIRCPAAFCGVTGFKPTYALVPTGGLIPLSYSLDHVSPMARSAEDCAILLDAMTVGAPRRPSGPGYAASLDLPLAGLRVGVDRERHLGGSKVDPAVIDAFDAAIDVLREAGAIVREMSIPFYDEVVGATMIITDTEAYSLHRHVLRDHWTEYGTSTRVQIAAGAVVPSADYLQAQRTRALGQQHAARMFEEYDVVVFPTAAIPALPSSYLFDNDLRELILSRIYTPIWDGLGNPAISVPMGFTPSGLPVGLQIAGPMFEDARVLGVGAAYQRLVDWHLRTPVSIGHGGSTGNV
jgi:aspartyl-tRNA(Asn)/glutamyl-tRNA(Gln) amidotransferase subunit A